MSADGSLYETPKAALQRARGTLHIAMRPRDGQTVLADLFQSGCLKARFPRRDRREFALTVMLNSSGGIAGGDVLQTRVVAGAGAEMTVTTQAAERIYRALPNDPPARIGSHIEIADHALLEWLPQETILFDQAALDRRLDIALAPQGRFLGAETLVFGRRSRGEQVVHGRINDLIRLRQGGRLLLHDAIRLQGAVAALLGRRASAAGGGACASIVYAAPDAEGRRDALRAALAGQDCEAGASCTNGILLARIVAASGEAARAAVVSGLAVLRDNRPLPRVWQC